jgi:hypothetical protein
LNTHWISSCCFSLMPVVCLAVPGVSERLDAGGLVEVPEKLVDADQLVRGVR